jgi:hypothetical protein
VRVLPESGTALFETSATTIGRETGTNAGSLLRLGPAHSGRTVRVLAALGTLALVGGVLPWLIARHHGALGIPRSDDWSYLRTLFHWTETGELNFNNWVSMTLLGQLVLARPLVEWRGADIAAVQTMTAAIGVLGLWCVYALGVTATARRGVALLVASATALGPLWGALAVSYMTDVPAFAASMATIMLGAWAVTGPRVRARALYPALALGFFGFAIREYATVPLIAIALVAGTRLYREERATRFRTFALLLIMSAAAVVAVLAFWRTIPDPKAFAPHLPDGHSVRALLYKGTGLVRLVGLLAVPALIVAGPARIVRRAWRAAPDLTVIVPVFVLGVLAFTGINAPTIAYAGNYVVPEGILARSVSTGPRPDIFPSGVFPALIVAGTLAAALLSIALVPWLDALPARVKERRFATEDPVGTLLGLSCFGYALAYVVAVSAGLPLYDRYVLPVAPLAALLVVRIGPHDAAEVLSTGIPARRAGVVAAAALAGLGAVGLVFCVDSASFDGTRWAVATAATSAGWTPDQIRGGFEWINYHAGDATPRELRRRPFCVNVIINPSAKKLASREVVARANYESPLTGPVLIAAFRTPLPCDHG